MNTYQKREKAKTGTETIEGTVLLTMREVCQLLHVHGNTVRRWSDQGIIKAYRIGQGRQRRFKAEDLAAFVVEKAERLRADTTKPRKFPKRAKSAS
jgi:excisionase family DNA binding protein